MNEIKKAHPLLDENGELVETGFARSLILTYDRKAIKAAKRRIKEWDYYLVANGRYAIALTIDDNSYMGLDSISLLDFETGFQMTASPMQWFTYGKKNFPSSSASGDIRSQGKDYFLDFKNEGNRRILTFSMNNFTKGKSISGELTLDCPETESMVIVTPFAEDKKAFYYNQKINCMPASGKVIYDSREYTFSPSDSFGVLDWGRGVWTYKNTWYWGSASGLYGGVPFGFNIGYGFGDTSAASENMLFYNNKAHKLSQVSFNIPQKDGKDDYMSPWTFTSDDGRFEMDFVPVMDRASKTDVFVICSDQHQVFGRFSGKAVLDDGTELKIENLTGFAEKVFNKW